MVDKEVLIKALKCSLEEHGHNCTGCHYRRLEECNDVYRIPLCVEIDGVKYWEDCNTNQMARDSIELLEKME